MCTIQKYTTLLTYKGDSLSPVWGESVFLLDVS